MWNRALVLDVFSTLALVLYLVLLLRNASAEENWAVQNVCVTKTVRFKKLLMFKNQPSKEDINKHTGNNNSEEELNKLEQSEEKPIENETTTVQGAAGKLNEMERKLKEARRKKQKEQTELNKKVLVVTEKLEKVELSSDDERAMDSERKGEKRGRGEEEVQVQNQQQQEEEEKRRKKKLKKKLEW